MPMSPAYSHSKIRRARLAAGRTVEDVARAAGISAQALYRIEAGEQNYGPRPTTAAALAAALGLSIEVFLNDDAA